jgi:hypothetical protein
VADVQLDAHGTLVGVEMRGDGLARGAFEKADEVRRGHDGGHAVAVKFHGMFHVRENGQPADFTDSGARFHFQEFNAKTRRREGAKNFLKAKNGAEMKALCVFASLRLCVKTVLFRQQIGDERLFLL